MNLTNSETEYAMSPSASPTKTWVIVAAAVLAEVALAFETMMIYAAVPRLNQVFGDRQAVGWLVTGFFIVSAASAAIGGRLGDLYGRRKVILYALALALLGSLVSGASSSLLGVFVGRCLQGCAACVLPLCIGVVRENLPTNKAALGVGVMISSAAIGTAGGQLLGGIIVDHFDWRMLFHVTAIFAGVGWAAIRWLVPTGQASINSGERLDVLGGVLFAPGLAALLYALNMATKDGFTRPRPLIFMVAGLLMLVLWVGVELRREHPMIDVRAVFTGRVGLANLVMALVAVTTFQASLVMSLLLQQPVSTGVGFGKSATFYGSVALPGALIAIAASPLAGALAARIGAKKVLIATLVLLVPIWAMSMLQIHEMGWMIGVILLTTVLGAVAHTSVPNLIIETSPLVRTSALVGFVVVIRAVFAGIGANIAVTMLAGTVADPLHPGVNHPSLSAYVSLFMLYGVLTLVAIGVVLMVPLHTVDSSEHEEVH